jgi:phosphoesterase RecJ-like protein
VVNPISAACGQIVHLILQDMGAQLDEPMAIALYTAVATDTGCFRFSNAQPETYEVAAACARVTPYLRELNHALFDTVSLARLKIQGWMVENAKFYAGGKICIVAIPIEVEKKIGVTEDDMENISGFPRTIAGVEIAATLRQEPDGRAKLSIRCLPTHDASAICAKFGGGGHRGAAGASFDLPLEEAAAAVLAAMPTLE